jgi:hypothetical protein
VSTTTAPEQATAPSTVAEHLGDDARQTGIVLVLAFAVVGGLAVSRAAAHVLTPTALAALVVGAAATLASTSWVNGVFGGALGVVTGAVRPPAEPSEGRDPFTFRSLWSSALVWGVGAAAWAGAGAGLAAVALDGRRGRFVVVFAAMVGLAGTAGLVANAVGRRTGIDGVRRIGVATADVVPLRQRAWQQLALPMAAVQLAVNAAMSVMLFHDYTTGDAFAPRALTETVALADVGVTVLIVSCLFAWFAGRWARVDVALGRVALDDPSSQVVSPKARIGRQGIVYLALFSAFVVGPMLGLLLPTTPSLAAVVVVRSVFAAVLVFVVAGLAYVRSAVNSMSVEEDRT